MKKLIAIVSVLAAGFIGTAKADITMSAGSNLEMQSIGSSTNLINRWFFRFRIQSRPWIMVLLLLCQVFHSETT